MILAITEGIYLVPMKEATVTKLGIIPIAQQFIEE